MSLINARVTRVPPRDFALGEIPAGAINNNIIITPLFTLGSIYSTNASGAEKMLARNNSN